MPSTVEHAIDVLAVLERESPMPLSVSEIAGRLRMTKPSTSRMMKTLLAAGLVSRDEGTRKFSLGLRLWEFGGSVLANIDVRRVALPTMAEGVIKIGRPMSLAVTDGLHVVHIERVAQEEGVVLAMPMAIRAPLHAVAVGKVLLAYSPARFVDTAVRRGLTAYTSRTITSETALMKELATIRITGLAFNSGEMQGASYGIAAAIRNPAGSAVAALGVSADEAELNVESEAAQVIRDVADRVSFRIGFRPERTASFV
jgi:DNA-binding IclR family transcriptional regulator